MVLVVNNDFKFLERALEVLNGDRQILLATNATQAYELARKLGLSVVLVDLDLPGDGLQLIERIPKGVPDLPIIAISGAFECAADIERARRLGVVEILKKPITPAWKRVVEDVRTRARLQ